MGEFGDQGVSKSSHLNPLFRDFFRMLRNGKLECEVWRSNHTIIKEKDSGRCDLIGWMKLVR
jgi:hypothetical protein